MIPEHGRPLVASKAAEASYVQALRGIARGVAEGATKALAKHLRAPESHGRLVRLDAGRIAKHTETVNILGVQVQTHIKKETASAFDKMAAQVDRKNALGVKAVIGIPRTVIATQPVIDTFREKNLALMAKAGADYVDKVREILENPANDGLRVEELADQFRAAADEMGEKGDAFASRAELIARDQTLKLNAQLTETRMTANGISRYTWSTSHDERVRPTHAEVEGQEFGWNDPPAVGSNGEKCNPGEDIQCRCVALPVLPDFDDL